MRFLLLLSICFSLSLEVNAMTIFLPPENPLLNAVAELVPLEEVLSDQVQGEIDYMFSVARGERSNTEKRVMVGLAAPQVGISKQIILVDMGVGSDRKSLGHLEVFINPEITWYSKELEEGRESCYSVDAHVAGVVSRSLSIQIHAWDRQCNPVTAELTGFTARIFQHEMDHLQGIRFPDRVGPDGKLHWIEESEFPSYRNEWQTWKCECSWDLWLRMKEGLPYKT